MRYLFAACCLLTGCFVLTSLVGAAAQDVPALAAAPAAGSPAPGVTVEGAGTGKLPADTLEYRAMILAEGATLADVLVEYDRATTKLSKALEQIGTKGIGYELRGALFSAMSDDTFRKRQRQAMDWGQEAPTHKCGVKDFVTFRAPLDGLSAKEVAAAVVSILETAAEIDLKDDSSSPRFDPWGRPVASNLPEGWTPGVSFVLRDTSALYAAAVKEALKDARAKAEAEASLAGFALGKMVAVETVSGGSVNPGTSRDLQHRVVLRVRYDLARGN